MPYPITTKAVTIGAGASLSGATFVGDGQIVGIITPAGWDAANITLQGSVDEAVTFFNLHDDAGAELTIVTAASRHTLIDPPIRGAPWVKVRSGTAGTPVNQADAVVVTVVVEKISRHVWR